MKKSTGRCAKDKKIYIIGTGVSPREMTDRTLSIIGSADVLAGGKRILEHFRDSKAIKYEIKSNINILLQYIKKRCEGKKTVVLASGDPNFYGIARAFYRAFAKQRIEVIPNITAFQTAFARIREPWDDAVFISVHGRQLENLDCIVRRNGTFVVYCDAARGPAEVARYLIEADPFIKSAPAWIFENLGTDEERIRSGKLRSFTGRHASPLSMMIIKNSAARQVLPFGIPDAAIAHQRGMITKRDVRLIALSRLTIAQARVLWDIGAGSGSVSIEAANLNPGLTIFAVEKDEKRHQKLVSNIRRFRLHAMHPVAGTAPDVLRGLPSPDAVFVGGSGGRLPAIMAAVKRRMRSGGALVVNCVTPEALNTALSLFRKWGWRYEVVAAQHAYLRSGARPEIFRPEHQVFIAHAWRQ